LPLDRPARGNYTTARVAQSFPDAGGLLMETANSRNKIMRSKLTTLGWLLVFLMLAQGYWWAMANFVISDFWDPQFAMKEVYLKARIAETPGHPLWLMLGSSRSKFGIAPSVMEDRMRSENGPLLFNFGLGGADLYRNYITLRRVVADGIKPKLVGIEIIQPLLNCNQTMLAEPAVVITRARRDEVDELDSFMLTPADQIRSIWRKSRINPFFKGSETMPRLTRSWRLVPVPYFWRFELEKYAYDKWGWSADIPAPVPRSFYLEKLELAKNQFRLNLTDFKVTGYSNRSLRKILDLCREQGIEAFLFLMPEGPDFQAFYSAKDNETINRYLAQIQNEYGIKMINARSWLGNDAFTDSHHLNSTGAKEFSRRFCDEMFKLDLPVAAP
jgi:hypothetical protein